MPSSSSRSFKYDVFFSFSGEDTRKNLVNHLYSALNQRFIRTYTDDITLQRDESVGPAQLEAIEESHFAVIIFSKTYADSSRCLDELVHIMKCREEMGLTVIPVFYDVDPSEVRYQERKFGEAFSKHEMKNVTKAELWRKALADATDIFGWDLTRVANGHESVIIKNIVDTISDKLISVNIKIDEEFVGMRDRVQELISMLQIGLGGVRMVGIWGVGGSGKTALATSVFMEIRHYFSGNCIVGNIREESSKHGLKILQEEVLSTLLKTQVWVQSVEEGRRLIKNRLCHDNVLILLDDVDDRKQLEALAGSHSWFGDGSRIIITTRDEHLLKAQVDQVFPVKLLSQDESIQLLKQLAYNEKHPLKDYETLSLRVVPYASGLPLALKVLGSFLYDKDEKEWTSTLARLEVIPETGILEKLKLSYDGLKSVEKELFLDIACFFRWRRKDDVIEILDACGFYPDIGIIVLREKALLTINSYGNFDMHDLVQEMAFYIVRGEHPNNPEKHSRVWKDEEINNLCLRDTTMENDIEALQYYDCDPSSRFCKHVSNMKKLRLLSVNMQNDDYVEGPDFLSNELRYFSWIKYPACPFPESFQPMKLAFLKLNWSFQKQLWKGYKHLPQLKVLQLSYSKKLVITPDFDGLPCLQKLELYECDDLEEIHPSLGNHKSLKYLDVSFCDKLKTFPTFVQMEKLETLQISWCHESLEFPDIQADLNNLVTMSLQGIRIQVLLSLIGERCTNLVSLYLVKCFISERIEVNFDGLRHLQDFRFCGITRPRNIQLCLFNEGHSIEPLQSLMSGTQFYISWMVFHQFTCSLQKLDLSGCRLEDGEIPSDIAEISNLQELDLSSNDFSKLHFSLLQLTRLKLLNLTSCNQLVELPELPSSIAIVIANKCDRLKSVGGFQTNFKFLCQVSLMNGRHLTDGDILLQSMLQGKANENHTMLLGLQGLEIPKGFIPHLRDGSECRLQLPENWCNDYCGFLMCAVLANEVSSSIFSTQITMTQVSSGLVGMDSQHDVVWAESACDKITWVGYVSFGSLRNTTWWANTWWDSNSKILFSISMPCSGFGVRLVPRKSGSDANETSRDSPEFSDDYTPTFKIVDDSTHAVKISLDFNLHRYDAAAQVN